MVSGIVFRDEIKNPLTVYDFDKDCWLKFHQKSKINIINLMESYSHISPKHIEAFSKLNNVTPGHYHSGNIGITCTNEKRIIGKHQVIQKILYLYSFCGNLDMVCGLQNLCTPTLYNRPDLWGLDLGINANMLSLWDDKNIEHSENLSNTDELPDLDDQGMSLQHDLVTFEAEEMEISTSQQASLNLHERFMQSKSQCKLIRKLLLTTKKVVLEQIIITLMCLPQGEKLQTYHINHFYDTCLSSTHAIHRNLTSVEIHTILTFIKDQCDKRL